MARAIVTLLIGLSIGAVAASVAARVHYQTLVAQARDQLEQARRQLDARVKDLEQQLADAQAAQGRLNQSLVSLESQVNNATRPAVAVAAPAPPVSSEMEAVAFAEPASSADSGSALGATRERRAGRRNNDSPDGGPGWGNNPARRQEMLDQMYTRIDANLMAMESAQTTQEGTESISAMRDLLASARDLRNQLAQAKTPEERETIEQALAQNTESMHTLVQQQQDSQIQRVADEFNIPSDQRDRFAEAVRTANSRQFFFPMGMRGPGRNAPNDASGRPATP